jgi:putative SOS response-associated peptidase YedK
MCGRFTLTATPEALNKLFPLFEGLDLQPQYNIAPSQNVLAVRLKPGSADPEAVWLRWGLIPSWADDQKIGYKLINARAETAREKPSFRGAFKSRHCLVLADGFYEWKKVGKAKQPYHIRLRDGSPFAFAGLWEHWAQGEKPIESCTILTTDANEALRQIHDRMPVILAADSYRHWLSNSDTGEANAFPYLAPYPPDTMTAVAVNPIVNSPRNNGQECLEPVGPAAKLF